MTYNKILKEIENIEVIDTHEHMLPPKYHKDSNYSFWNLMIPYVQFDLVNAGMCSKFMWQNNLNQNEVDECFNEFIKFWKYVKYGGWGKHVLRVLSDSFGITDINSENYLKIGELLNQTKTKNHYRDIIKNKCNIKAVLNQCSDEIYEGDDDYFKGYADVLKNGIVNDIKLLEISNNKSLDDLIELVSQRLYNAKARGAKFTKFDASCFMFESDKSTSQIQLNSVLNGEQINTEVLQSYVYRDVLSVAQELNMVCAVHTGVWDNIYRKSPQHLFKIVDEYKKVKFDIYHMGIPFIRECAFLGKNFPNVYLNLCWSHIVSPLLVKNSLDEWLDLVPLNKIFAFGGDHATLPINIVSHLNLAKENIAFVFASRVDRGEIEFSAAIEIIKSWFYDNPKKVYGL